MKKLIILVFFVLTGCGSSDYMDIHTLPGLMTTDWTMQPGEEQTPVVFDGRLLIVMFQRPVNETPFIQVVDFETKTIISVYRVPNFTIGSAIVVNGVLYVYGTTGLHLQDSTITFGNSIELVTTSDLVNWNPPQEVYRTSPDTAIWNLSVSETDHGFIMAYDFSSNPSEVFSSQARFLVSNDLYHWNSVNGVLTGMNNYLAAITIRYIHGYYYAAYTQSYHNKDGYYLPNVISRSKDLTNWELSTYALVSPLDETIDEHTSTDADLAEFNGKTYVIYSTGPQNDMTKQILRARVCDCLIKNMFESMFIQIQ